MAELIAAVYVKDPETPGAAAVLFRPGDDVPERFWAGMSNPGLWKDGDVPSVRPEPGGHDGDGDGAEDAPVSDDKPAPAEPESEPDKKPAARKAAPKTGSRRQAAAEGTGGQ